MAVKRGAGRCSVSRASHAGCDVFKFANRFVASLSGGQQQRAWIAMMLAQQSLVLLLDEPTTFLDIAHQLEVLDLLQRLNAVSGTTIALVLHDLNLTARYSDNVVMMKDGLIAAAGSPLEVITEESLGQVFSVRCTILSDPATNQPFCIPVGATPDS